MGYTGFYPLESFSRSHWAICTFFLQSSLHTASGRAQWLHGYPTVRGFHLAGPPCIALLRVRVHLLQDIAEYQRSWIAYLWTEHCWRRRPRRPCSSRARRQTSRYHSKLARVESGGVSPKYSVGEKRTAQSVPTRFGRRGSLAWRSRERQAWKDLLERPFKLRGVFLRNNNTHITIISRVSAC